MAALPIMGDSAGDLARLFQILQQATKVDLSGYKLGTVHRRILRRMGFKKIASPRDYVVISESTRMKWRPCTSQLDLV